MDPRTEYTSRRNAWKQKEEAARRTFINLGNWRLLDGISAVVILWLAIWKHALSLWWLLIPLLLFVGLTVGLVRLTRRRVLALRAIRFYETGLARVDDRWITAESPGEHFRQEKHVYADDLDLFGRGSLFAMLALPRTAAGEATLAGWLLAPASPDVVLARHEAVAELGLKLELREELALLGEDVRSEVHAAKLASWGAAAEAGFPPVLRPLALLLGIGGVASLLALFSGVLPAWPFLTILGINLLVMYVLRRRTHAVLGGVETPARDLQILALVLARLEQERFEAPLLQKLRLRLNAEGKPASRAINHLRRWMEIVDSSDHIVIRALRPVTLWDEQLAMAIESWRKQAGLYIGEWISAVAEMEALSSFGTLAFEHPSWTFPQLSGDDTLFEARTMRHPLLPRAECVPNDIQLSSTMRLLIVSGSNMSGKSTLLRSIGLNTVLAWAGAPVAADFIRISPLQTGASIRIVDSLQDHRSRFFAEISRIREIVDLSKSDRPVLFLLDELLSGTNSHDRRIGASGIIRNLVDSGAIGLVSTHDLALAQIATDLGEIAANVHFEDQLRDGQMHFDFRLRPGVVTHSNALALMRAVGLDV